MKDDTRRPRVGARTGAVRRLVATCLITLFAPSLASAQPAAGTSPFDAARALGDVEQLRQLSTTRDDSPAMCVRAELALLDADIPKAERFARLALERATDDDQSECAVATLSRALFDQGKRKEAEDALRAHLGEHPLAHRVRLELGRLLVDRGAKDEAEVVLAALSNFFNNNALKGAPDLTVLSEAMAKIDSYDDANYAMQRAIEADPRNAEALVAWGELLLEKYNTADAEVTFDEALGLNPKNVDALVGKARVELQLSNDYTKIRGWLRQVEEIAPQHVGMLLTRAEVAVYDTDCDAARGFAQKVLEHRPAQLEALTFIAACDYLDDDKEAFARSKAKVFALNPRYVDVLSETSRYAVRVHRYEEAAALDREALEIVPDHGPSLLSLGIGLSRIGKEMEALETLQRAFEIDPYNVRAYNMVELYETQMKDYVFVDHDRFLLRAHRNESKLVDALVSPVVHEALQTFDAKYGFQPSADYLSVEVFPNPTTFAVRSVGLPNVSPHGICFGKVVVSRSLSEGNFNWRQVIWHELAHVYHIQLANSRVPRWFTEGLAEYETNVKDPGWQRHHDRELARALNSGGLRGVLELSEGFTHARSYEEILRSYHQSSLVIHFIAESWGFEKLPQMLRSWGAFKKTPAVLNEVLGLDAKTFDAKFEKWLAKRYLNFKGQLTVDLAGLPTVSELEAKVRDNPTDGLTLARLAIARYRVQDVAGADAAIAQAVRAADDQPEVYAIAALYSYDRGRVKDAYDFGHRVLDAGRDSYDLRVLLGSAAMKLELPDDAEVHLRSAATLWDGGAEVWKGLARIARSNDDDRLELLAQRRMFLLDQNDARIARLRGETMKEQGDWAATYDAARRWVDINPTDSRSHEALIESALALKQPKLAFDGWAALAVLRPGDSEDILLGAIRTLREADETALAQKLGKKAVELDVPEPKVREALK